MMRDHLHTSAVNVIQSRARLLSIFVGLLGVAGGCGSDTTGPTTAVSENLYWALQLPQHAVNLALVAPYDTIRLTAIPVSPAGHPIVGSGVVKYTSSDSTVTVDASGLVTAHYVTTSAQNAQIIASLRLQNETLTDTVLLHVTATPTRVATFSVQPVAGDSGKVAVDYSGKILTIHATDATSVTLPFAQGNATDLVGAFRSSDPTVAAIDPYTGAISPQRVGHVTFTATTWASGVAWSDSIPYVIGYKLGGSVGIHSYVPLGSTTPVYYFLPPLDTIGVGGSFVFVNRSVMQALDVVFSDSTQIVGGNIAPYRAVLLDPACVQDANYDGCALTGKEHVTRVFPVAGTYQYHSRLLGASGTLVVRSGP